MSKRVDLFNVVITICNMQVEYYTDVMVYIHRVDKLHIFNFFVCVPPEAESMEGWPSGRTT